MGVKVTKQITPSPAIGVEGKCFQFKNTAQGAPDVSNFETFTDCNDCQGNVSSFPICSRRYARCDVPENKFYLPCTPYSDTFIRNILQDECYIFEGIDTDTEFDITWEAFVRGFSSCNNCSGNKKYEEITGCQADIVISRVVYEALGSKPFISVGKYCYRFKNDTGDLATGQVPALAFDAKCDCAEDVNYNVEWTPCAGKQGGGPDKAIKAWDFNPGEFMKIEGGCYQKPQNPCDVITCAVKTGGDLTAYPSCEACEPDEIPSEGTGGGGGGPVSIGESSAESSLGAYGSALPPFSDGTNCTVYQNCDDPNDEINIPETHAQFANVIRIGGVDGECYEADGKLYTDIFETPVLERFDTCFECANAVVQLQLHFNGETGADIFPDVACNLYDVIATASAQVDTTTPLFGTGNLRLNGTTDYISLSPDFNMLSAEWDIEFFVNLTSAANQGLVELILIGDNPTTNKTRLEIYTDASGFTVFNFYESDVLIVTLTDTISIGTGSMIHIAVTREVDTWRLFVGGVLIDSATDSTSIPALASLDIGQVARLSLFAGADIAEFRIITGAPMYTLTFTPPIEAFSDCDTITPPTVDTLRVKASEGYIDISTTNGTVTNNGTTIVEDGLNGKDVFDFDGASSILVDAINGLTNWDFFLVFKPDVTINSGDNTDEALIGPVSVGAYGNISIGSLATDVNETLMITEDGVGSDFAQNTIPDNFNLIHITNDASNEVRQGGDLKSLTTDTGTPTQLTKIEQIGAYLSSQFLNGQIAEIAIYSSKLSTSDRNKFYSYIASEYGL